MTANSRDFEGDSLNSSTTILTKFWSRNEECVMSVVNLGIPRLKVTDPTVLSIKELISWGDLGVPALLCYCSH